MLLSETLREFVNCGTEYPSNLLAHVLNRIDAKSVDVGVGDPVLVTVDKPPQRWRRRRVFSRPVDRQVQLLEIKKVPLPKLWVEIKVPYPAFAHETTGSLQLSWPDGSVGPGCLERPPIWWIKRQDRLTIAVAESFDLVRLSVPPRIRDPTVLRNIRLITCALVPERICGVIENHIEDAVDALFVCCIDQVAQIFART